jgi:hypothetical protein
MGDDSALLEETMRRQESISSLIEAYQEKYHGMHKANFYVHPEIEFSPSDHGIAVKAAAIIPRGTSLLILPVDENVSVSREDFSQFQPISEQLKSLYDAEAESTVVHGRKLKEINRLEEVTLEALILWGMIGEMDQVSLLSKAINTWPELTEFRQVCSIFELSSEAKLTLRGTPLAEWLDLRKEGNKFVFEKIITPLLDQNQIAYGINQAWEAYLRACYVVRSRACEGPRQGEPEIIPLLDQFNGLPESCNKKGKCNIIMDRHMGRTHVFASRTVSLWGGTDPILWQQLNSRFYFQLRLLSQRNVGESV